MRMAGNLLRNLLNAIYQKSRMPSPLPLWRRVDRDSQRSQMENVSDYDQ